MFSSCKWNIYTHICGKNECSILVWIQLFMEENDQIPCFGLVLVLGTELTTLCLLVKYLDHWAKSPAFRCLRLKKNIKCEFILTGLKASLHSRFLSYQCSMYMLCFLFPMPLSSSTLQTPVHPLQPRSDNACYLFHLPSFCTSHYLTQLLFPVPSL